MSRPNQRDTEEAAQRDLTLFASEDISWHFRYPKYPLWFPVVTSKEFVYSRDVLSHLLALSLINCTLAQESLDIYVWTIALNSNAITR